MGAVYRATDTSLGRQVAIKVLPDAFAQDAERLARFEREARTLASLNHPHIAQIYAVEKSGGATALVMELVEGEDLSERIRRGPIAIDEALPIAKQIAEALEAAHEQGIVHRDLKPANIKVRHDGTVKVLDFGLAKAVDPGSGGREPAANLANSPTITSPAMTMHGVILGTAAYMSPEQARGRVVDKRTDIWAFGAVLYEMLTGRRPFEGEDASLTLAAVMKSEPDFSALPNDLPPAIRAGLVRCLNKDVRQRLRDIGDVRLLLEGAFDHLVRTSAMAAPPRLPLWRRALPVVATAVIVSAIAAGVVWSRPQTASAPAIVTRFPIVLPSDHELTRQSRSSIAVSPDGARIVYVANDQLYLREMGDTEAHPIPGSQVDPASIFFSPDGQSIGFATFRDRELKTIPITGGTPVAICKIENLPYGGHWAGDHIVFASPPGASCVCLPAAASRRCWSRRPRTNLPTVRRCWTNSGCCSRWHAISRRVGGTGEKLCSSR